ncbi:hypothetical protein BH09BAC5_BH09BAC5_13600 [soil metagenome]
MKYFLSVLMILFLISCEENKPSVNLDSLKTDSALKALQSVAVPAKNDTTGMAALPIVFEGDIVLQISNDPQSIAFGNACNSKYNHAGIIFMRPKDNRYVVMEVKDSVVITPLNEWVAKGKDGHFALLRLKHSNEILSAKKTDKLKTAAKNSRGKKYDYFYNWSDDSFYSTELVWKIYRQSLNIEICETGKLGDGDFTGTLLHGQMLKKYGLTIPKDEIFISPEQIYKSSKLDIAYER